MNAAQSQKVARRSSSTDSSPSIPSPTVPSQPLPATLLATLPDTPPCSPTRACRRRVRPLPPLSFLRRVRELPVTRALAGVYKNARESNSLLGCCVLSAELATVLATAPAAALAGPLRSAFATPVYVTDMLLCKWLDLAEKAFPCIASTPKQLGQALAFTLCGVPAGATYLSCKLACKCLRLGLCDLPAVACGIPALACCAAAEACLCRVPAALFAVPARVTCKAARTAVADARGVMRAVEECCQRVAP